MTVTSNLHQSFKYQITDIQGKELKTGFNMGSQEFRVDISALKPGIYLFIIENDNNRKTDRFVKK